MKITYTPNPLDTIIELDEHEQEMFKLKLKIHELEEDLGSAAVYLDPKNASWTMNASLADALRKLREYEPKASWAGWEAHADRWAREAKHAYEWLKAYQEEHFPDLDGVAGDTEPASAQSHTATGPGASGALSAT